jgi:hypothetical protein
MALKRGVENVFRAANERLRSRMEGLSYRGRRPVICECSDPDCLEVIDVSRDEYQAVRDGGNFIVAPGHETGGVQRVGSGDGYDVVAKS